MRGEMEERKLSKREKFLEMTIAKVVFAGIVSFCLSIAMPDWNRADCAVCYFVLWFILTQALGDLASLVRFLKRRYF